MSDDELEGGAVMMQETNTANGLFADLRKLSPVVTGGLLRMRQQAYWDRAVSAKYKLLTAMAISIAIRCDPCIRAYVRLACDQGITREEFVEFLEVAMTMQGCPGEEWALKAYAAYKDCVVGQTGSETSACCKNDKRSQPDEEEASSVGMPLE